MVPVGKNGKSTVKDLQPYRGMAYSSDSLKAHCRLKKVELEHIFHLLTVWSGRNRCWTFEATVSPLLLHDFRRTEPMADPAESPSLSSVRRVKPASGIAWDQSRFIHQGSPRRMFRSSKTCAGRSL